MVDLEKYSGVKVGDVSLSDILKREKIIIKSPENAQRCCIYYLENICNMFVRGCKNCEGQALEYQQMYISAIRHAIAKLQGGTKE